MHFDPLSRKYPSGRSLVYARHGMVCTSQPLAAGAGLDILKRGGNAVDAAVAAAACMTVLEPTSNGLGSDAFTIAWVKGEIYGLNASGKAPMSLTAEKVQAAGYTAVPDRGWYPVMVPGAVAGWKALSDRFGRLPFAEVLAPAIRYAEEGYAVSPVVARLWKAGFDIFSAKKTPEYLPWMEHFAPGGHAPAAGEIWRSPDMARTLAAIAETGAESFYRGELAEKTARFSEETGGFLIFEDLAGYAPEWVKPVSVNYRGTDVWEMPPNGDGIVVLMALAILNHLDLDKEHPESERNVHRIIEALKLGYEDGLKYIADPRSMEVSVESLLSSDYARRRAALIGEEAMIPAAGNPNGSGTIYLCTADEEGNMVSHIQSNYNGFGSGIVIPGTGISLQNRGKAFSLDPSSPNVLAPGKKSFHTIIPGFLSRDGKALGPFGVMGAFMQPQGQLQVLTNLLDFGMNPQEALDRSRWQWIRKKQVETEAEYPEEIRQALSARGHEMSVNPDHSVYGRGQIILRNEDGVLCGASEPRADGCAAGW
ncbi:MAG: gamma-glutamyltransferase family protein [Clostridium sp.]|nr:gamma-glutamyltransferase family protein [Clostridium sp.]